MTIGDNFTVSLIYQIPGKQGVMNAHFQQLEASAGDPSLDGLFCYTEVAEDWATTVAAFLPDTLSFIGAYISQAKVGLANAYPYLWLFDTPIVGGLTATDTLPEGQGPLVLLGPDVLSTPRRQTNRMYLPLIREEDQKDGAIKATLVSIIETALDPATVAGNIGTEFGWVTYSRLNEAEAFTPSWPVATVRVADQIARIVKRRPKYQGRF